MSIGQILPSIERLRRENERLKAKCEANAEARQKLHERIYSLKKTNANEERERNRVLTEQLEEARATNADLRKIITALEKEIARIIRAHALKDLK